MEHVFDRLTAIVGASQVRQKEPMRLHTTFRVGGPADFFVTPQTEEQLSSLLTFCKNSGLSHFIIGNGSNLLVSDSGYRGVIIQLFQNHNRISVDGTCIYAQSGALLSKIAAEAQNSGLTGFEFAAGIPGTMGGACMMNAGAYGGEMKDVLISVRVMNPDGSVCKLPAKELDLGYRSSSLDRNNQIVLEGTLSLTPGDPRQIADTIQALAAKRRAKQPLEYPSAGSTFKRPPGHFAGQLIQNAGLAGYTSGGACVSEKHCGFVINKGNASAEDVWNVIRHVQEEVERQFHVHLHTEVKLLGDF